MWYHSFWKVAAVLLGLVLALALIVFGLLIYIQLRNLKGVPIITNVTTTNTSSDNAITRLIPTSTQKSQETSTNNNSSTNSTSTYTPTVDDDPVIGANTARVTIIAFEDFQCPYCAAATPVLRTVLQQYPNDVKLVFRDFPLYTIHPQASVAALAGECADDQGQFWQWHDLVFQRQASLELAPTIFYDWANELGLNVATFQNCLDTEKHSAEVERDQNSGILAGVAATPTFFVNGYKVEGALSQEQWSLLIDVLLAEDEVD